MNFSQRSYTNGETFRPKPVIVEKPESGLLVIATPWGNIESAQKVVEIIVEQFELLSKEEMTSPLESLPSLSPAANKLRNGLLLANQYVCKNDNAKQWRSAVEVSALHYANGVLSWVHVGSPHILLSDGSHIHPVAYDVDWAAQSHNKGPLFSQALGLDAGLQINAGSVRLAENSQVLLLARSNVPGAVFAKPNFDIESLLEELIRDKAEMPCWLGLLDVA